MKPSVLALAVAVAFGCAWFAPDPWPEEGGRIEATFRGQPVEPLGRVAGHPNRIAVQIPEQENPRLDELSVHLVFPDGRRELVPVMRGDKGLFHAERRPPKNSGLALGLLGLVVVLWVTEAIPLFVTSLLVPIVLVVAGALSAPAALAPFSIRSSRSFSAVS